MRPLSRPQPGRPARRPQRRALVTATVTGLALTALAGCSETEQRGYLPRGITTDSDRITDLWRWSWVAALAVGVLVWGLTIWCIVAYRKRRGDADLPEQLRYNLPMEILYTVVPLLMIGVLFFYTQRDERAVYEAKGDADNVVNVVGKRWAWDFNYVSDNAYESSTQVNLTGQASDAEKLPVLYMPVNEKTRFYLTSRDVAHSFWVPAFLKKMDLIPGRVNTLDVTPTQVGTFIGKCAELCGTYHAQMLFEVHVVSAEEYSQHMAELKAKGQEGQLPNSLNQEGLVPEDRDIIPTPGGSSS